MGRKYLGIQDRLYRSTAGFDSLASYCLLLLEVYTYVHD